MLSKRIFGHFPNPYPDELLFSLCARFSDRVQYASSASVCIELFGHRHTAGVIDLPRHIDYFTDKFPRGHILTANKLILEHTMLPFYSPFLTVERAKRIKESMINSEMGSTSLTVATNRRHNFLNYLRFCPLCVESDERLCGECYWHRSHQIPGINVCYRHAVFLENSAVLARYKDHSSLYISAARAKVTTKPHPIDWNNPEHKILLDLSQDSYWFLNQPGIVFGYKVLHGAYVELLRIHGLALATGNVKVIELHRALRERYPSSILNCLQSNFEERKRSSWPSRFIKDLNITKAHRPQKHLLIIRLLGHSAESFAAFCMKDKAKSPWNHKPFGSGPWPCLNPVCKDYKRLVIRSCEVSIQPHNNYGHCGTFACCCGFIYTRISLNQSFKDQFRYNRVKVYGTVWNNTLKNLWGDTSISVQQIARRLCVKFETIKFRAAFLRLHFPRFGPHGSVTKATQSLLDCLEHYQRNKSEEVNLKRRINHRMKWLENLKKHPKSNRTELQRLLPGSYNWLFAYDREWFQQNQPMLRKRAKADWTTFDAQLAYQVRVAAKRIKNLPSQPMRITKASIFRDIRNQDNLMRVYPNDSRKSRLERLPQTAQAFSEVIEQLNAFYIRKIAWAANCFRQEGIAPSHNSLIRRASIRWNKQNLPEVKVALQAVLEASQIYLKSEVNAA